MVIISCNVGHQTLLDASYDTIQHALTIVAFICFKGKSCEADLIKNVPSLFPGNFGITPLNTQQELALIASTK